MNKTLRVIVLLFAGILQLHGQCDLQLSGTVLDEHDLTPLDYSTIYVLETGQGTLADSLGAYTLSGLCPGKITVVCSHVGCDPVQISLILNRDTTLNFYPEHHIEVLDQVVTTANKVAEAPAQTRTDLSGQTLERLQGRSLAQMLESVSGVTMVQTGPGIAKPMIHGLYGNRILIVQNDVRQEGQQWGIDHAPEIDPTVAGTMTVIKGAEGVRYGPDALGGVILVKPDPLPRSAGLTGSLMTHLQSNGLGGKVSGQIQGGLQQPGWGWRATGSLRLLGDQYAPDYILSNTGQKEWGFSAQAGYTGNKGTLDLYYSLYQAGFGILRAAHIGNTTDLQAAIQADEPWIQNPFTYEILNPQQRVIHHLAKVEASRKISGMWTLKGRYSLQFDERKEYDVRRGDRDNIPALDLTIISQQGEILAEHRPWRHLAGTIGSSVQYQSNYNVPGTGVRPLIPNFISTTASVFAFERYIQPAYELEAGVRADYRSMDVAKFNDQDQLIRPTFDWFNISGSAGGLFRFSPDWQATLQVASAFRAPGANELFSEGLHHATAALEIGNDSLGIERSLKTILTIQNRRPGWTINLSTYLNPIYGFIYLRPTGDYELTIRGAFPVFRYQQTNALLAGLDLDLTIAMTSWLDYQGQAALLWSDDLQKASPLFGMPPMQFRHSLRLHNQPDASGAALSAGIQIRQVLRQDQSPTEDFAPPPSGYTLVGLTAEWSRGRIRINAGVDNLLCQSYRDYLDRLRYFADAPGRNYYLKTYVHF
ncbi:MAG: TonB-dependent receptor [Saprospiraceae bacterium]|nr:TonB-dependent receptor [Saprospiraceae bacterium]